MLLLNKQATKSKVECKEIDWQMVNDENKDIY